MTAHDARRPSANKRPPSPDVEAWATAAQDPLVYRGKAPVRTIADVLTAAERLPGRLHRLELPLLVMHGTADSLVAVAGSRMIHDRASCGDKTLKLYEGLYHELINEPEKDSVIEDLLGWLGQHS